MSPGDLLEIRPADLLDTLNTVLAIRATSSISCYCATL